MGTAWRDLDREVDRTAASAEGILLSPVHTDRPWGGLLYLIHRSTFRLNERALFWHASRMVGLFVYSGEIE